ncbi:MAG TPA: sulfur oxidation c-type cytochrome SoxA [Gammaproteobacteria bacterium]|nr:sulfur oxidation c-type cytochrome SoxA [Gammaproteobacteria bacterium]
MKKLFITLGAISIMGIVPLLVTATPQSDLQAFRTFYFKKFPGIKFQDYANGIYALDKNRRIELQASEEFPPYDDAVAIGKKLFNKYGLKSCFKRGGIGIKQNYPYFDKKTGKVRTLEKDIMTCLKEKGINTKKEKLKYKKGKFAAISAYMAYTSRGNKINVVIPNDPRALADYEAGKRFFYAKRGQLNFSCANCHVDNVDKMIRGNLLGPALGQTSHWPAWRKKWAKKAAKKHGGNSGPLDGLGTLQRRYGGCNKQVRAKPLKAQSTAYNNLEYFHTYMSNGIKLNGPAVRQ